MWMKYGTLLIFCICILSYVKCQVSGVNYCEPGEIGYQDCEAKKAVCKMNNQSYICECPVGLHFGVEGNGECEEIDMCGSDSQGYRFCESDLALCRNAPNDPKGYECYCAEGKVKIGGLCTDVSDVQTSTDPTANSSSSSLLSSSVFSSTGTENTSFGTFNVSSKSNITFAFTSPTSPEPASSTSTFGLPTLTASYNFDLTTSSISEAPNVDECARHHCSQNATCIKLKHGFTCQCKVGFVPLKKLSAKSHCLSNCTVAGCEDTCKEIKCILKEEEEKNVNASGCIYFENRYSGWPIESIIICSILAVIILIFVAGTALLFHRNKKLKKMKKLEDKQIVYKKMDKDSLCNESPWTNGAIIPELLKIQRISKNLLNKCMHQRIV